MKIRVVTSTAGTSPYFAEAVSSVASLAASCEHIVVAPFECKAHLVASLGEATFLPEVGSGLYPNLNAGASGVRDWQGISWINDDDVLHTAGFGTAIRAIHDRSDVDIVYGRVRILNAMGLTLGFLPVSKCEGDLQALLHEGIIPIAQPGTIIRRRLWERLGGVDESYELAGDLDFFVRALMSGARFSFVDTEVASFRLSAGQLSKRRAQMQAETERALRPLRGIKPSRLALWRFRLHNLPVYFDRIRRHGWISMQELSDRTQ